MRGQAVHLLLRRLSGAPAGPFLSFRVCHHLPALAEAGFETLTSLGQSVTVSDQAAFAQGLLFYL